MQNRELALGGECWVLVAEHGQAWISSLRQPTCYSRGHSGVSKKSQDFFDTGDFVTLSTALLAVAKDFPIVYMVSKSEGRFDKRQRILEQALSKKRQRPMSVDKHLNHFDGITDRQHCKFILEYHHFSLSLTLPE
jgi:hypothetical protein